MDDKSHVKIDFINLEEFRDESISYPVGILSISAFLKKSGFTNIGLSSYTCTLRKVGGCSDSPFVGRFLKPRSEWIVEERRRSLEGLFSHLQMRQPHIILIGPVTTFYLVELTDLVPKLRKQFSEQVIIAGGPHFGKDTALDEELLDKCPGLDGIVIGEAEETIAEFAERLHSLSSQQKRTPSRREFRSILAGVSGIGVRDKKPTRRNPPDLTNLPFPDMQLLEQQLGDSFEYKFNPKYKLSDRRNPVIWISSGIVDSFDGGADGAYDEDVRLFNYEYPSRDARFPFGVIIGSRACSYRCSFCCTSGTRRTDSAKRIFSQIMDLNSRYGIQLFVFFDAFFVDSSPQDQERIKQLCTMILDAKLKIAYMIETRADVVCKLPDELLKLIINSGCIEFNFGFEKGNDKTLQKMMKGTTVEEHHRAVEKLKRIAHELNKRVTINGTFILGGPEETKNDVKETLMHCWSLHLDQATFYPMQIYPGTKIMRDALKEGIITHSLDTFLNAKEYPLYSTQTLPSAYLLEIIEKNDELHQRKEDLKKTMQGVERQFLPESQRDNHNYFEIDKTKPLQEQIENSIDSAVEYLRTHPDEDLRKNGQLNQKVESAFQEVEKSIAEVENGLLQNYPHYEYKCGDYYPGSLLQEWRSILELFEKLFSKDNF
jgi:radical SAM superfamily enzyme YgiQ (UPF0313 family)